MLRALHGSLVHEHQIGRHGDAFAALREVYIDDMFKSLLGNVSQLSRCVPSVWKLRAMSKNAQFIYDSNSLYKAVLPDMLLPNNDCRAPPPNCTL